MAEHSCTKEEFLGRVKEFMENMKGTRGALYVAILTIIAQVITFAVLWGKQGEIVAKNTEQIWCKLTPAEEEQAKSIAIILDKFKNIKIVGFASAEEVQKIIK